MTKRLEGAIRARLSEQADRANLTLSSEDWKSLALDVELNALGLAVVADKKRADAKA
jgi:hypothetical protein